VDGDDDETDIKETAGASIIGLAVAAAAVIDPALGIVAAGSVPVMVAGAQDVLGVLDRRRERRQASVLAIAAAVDEVAVGTLVHELERTVGGEDLLVRTLEAAGSTSQREKLIAYAVALRSGIAGDADAIARETTFVRALDDMDLHHVELLRRFTKTWTDLSLEPEKGFGFDIPARFRVSHLDKVASGMQNPPALLAVLQRHGLVASYTKQLESYADTNDTPVVGISQFGLDFLRRLDEIGERLGRTGTR
jgi:hypothetical protein